tara:strand:- start:592 stop:984 length:393 start_codon:yes stop_codon:yes gene_type:complete
MTLDSLTIDKEHPWKTNNEEDFIMKSINTVRGNWFHILNFAILIALLAIPIATGRITLAWTIFVLVGLLNHWIQSTTIECDGKVPQPKNISAMMIMAYEVIWRTLGWPVTVIMLISSKLLTRLETSADYK